MGKFKKGDWVRVTDNAGAPRDYKNGEILQVESVGSTVRCIGKGGGMYPYRFEPWQPKVGERVTTNGNALTNIEQHWNEHFRRSGGDIIDGALVVTSVSDHAGSNVGLSNKVGRSHFFMPANTLRPAAPVVAILTIEAGKLYRTRDGRKVGPMYYCGSYWSAGSGANGTPGHFTNDGVSAFCGIIPRDPSRERHDLISEWVDEPAQPVAVAAESAVANDNAVKFKVGDRVVERDYLSQGDCFGTILRISSCGKHAYAEDWSIGSRKGELQVENLELAPLTAIVALIENGTAEPATRPKVHTNQATATEEAARLALEHPGQQFGVFVLADSKIADIVTTQTAVLRAA